MKKIAIIYGGPDDEHNFYGEKVKEILEKITAQNNNFEQLEKYEVVQIFMTRESSFKVFNPKHTNKKLFFSLNKIFKFINDQNIKLSITMLTGAYGDSKIFENKLKENNIEIKKLEDVMGGNMVGAIILN